MFLEEPNTSAKEIQLQEPMWLLVYSC